MKATQIRRIENLYLFKSPPESVATTQLLHEICSISAEIRRQIGLLIERTGKVVAVIIGDHQQIMLPDTSQYRTPPGRLKGIRCIHTHLKAEEALTRDDLTDLALLRLDLMAAVTLTADGLPGEIYIAHILPSPDTNAPYEILSPVPPENPGINCLELVRAIETELARYQSAVDVEGPEERAILVSVATTSKDQVSASMAELTELAVSSGIQVIDTVIQRTRRIHPRFLMGTGKLEDLTVRAMQLGATMIIFDQELNPSQMRSITDRIDLKVIDRTQLILDIFAQRAQSREGKIQVELAQLKYTLPRLMFKNTALSRLTGGIGGRGPGETKLEINRRRIRDRISRLERQLEHVRKNRQQQKSRRIRKGLPVISIIGYTNAGKSTLLNTLTHSHVLAESRLFATLDPSSRRLRFPRDTEVIITDTVGFIKDMPKELRVAFRATLEELEGADLLLHVIDAANPDYAAQIKTVDRILSELELHQIPVIRVLNKMDIIDAQTMRMQIVETGGIPISANAGETLMPLIEKMETTVSPSGIRTERYETR